MKSVRGAITIDANTREAIAEATETLLATIRERNAFRMDEVVSVFFTMTPDLNADFPARAARAAGWDVPLLDMVEVDVPSGIRACLRLLMHVDTREPVQHAYLRGARALRPDLERDVQEQGGGATPPGRRRMTYAGISPTLDEVRASGIGDCPVVLTREVLADLDTPVSAYLKIRGSAASFLLESVEGGQNVSRYSFLGSDPRHVLRVRDGQSTLDRGKPEPCPDPLSAVEAMVNAYGPRSEGLGRFQGGAVGYLSYEAARSFERLPAAENDPLGLPDAAFMDVDTLLIFDHARRAIRILSHAWPGPSVDESYARAAARIERIVEQLEAPVPRAPLPEPTARPLHSNMTKDEFESIVRAGKEHIYAGDILQAVLSQRLSIPFEGDAFGLYRRLRTVSPSPYLYFLDYGDHQIVGASPELLVQVEDGTVTTRPIAGTRPRGASEGEDRALADELRGDEKERAEHLMLVDLARNDVGRVSAPGTVEVANFMSVERFSHVMHLVTDVRGRLKDGCTPYDALRAAFPAGTLSGAPKIRAMQIIAALEPDRRGAYGGAVGFVSKGGDMETAITIRTGVIKDGVLHVQAGAGIVADSVPETEWQETMNKARPLIVASGGQP